MSTINKRNLHQIPNKSSRKENMLFSRYQVLSLSVEELKARALKITQRTPGISQKALGREVCHTATTEDLQGR